MPSFAQWFRPCNGDSFLRAKLTALLLGHYFCEDLHSEGERALNLVTVECGAVDGEGGRMGSESGSGGAVDLREMDHLLRLSWSCSQATWLKLSSEAVLRYGSLLKRRRG